MHPLEPCSIAVKERQPKTAEPQGRVARRRRLQQEELAAAREAQLGVGKGAQQHLAAVAFAFALKLRVLQGFPENELPSDPLLKV